MRWRVLLCGLLAAAVAVPGEAAEKKACKLVRFSEIPITTLADGRFTVPVVVEDESWTSWSIPAARLRP